VYRALILLCLSGYASAHEWTPTYPSLRLSHVPGILTTDMFLFNSRADVDYYQISVWDENWNSIKFATESKTLPLQYLDRKKITIYIREKDKDTATYICSKSKLIVEGKARSSIASRICSKIKG